MKSARYFPSEKVANVSHISTPNANKTPPVSTNQNEFFNEEDITSCPEDPWPTTEYCKPTEITRIITPTADTIIPRLLLLKCWVGIAPAPAALELIF